MSGDFEQWNPEPMKEKSFRSQQDYKEVKRERKAKNLVAALFCLAVAVLLGLYLMGVLR